MTSLPRRWTAEEIAAELVRRSRLVAEGICPDSGLPLSQFAGRMHCGVCDCWGHPLREGVS